ncbi:acetylxylan esterase [Paenibacillus senegalensis]|uniref:acetylxylan esterase n=1 Tax=Paenibacillus senegalensis TaxID=1465766 RepID=UPI00028850C8|nr:acetylxylan esterase [Paenibacillus senegalensis]
MNAIEKRINDLYAYSASLTPPADLAEYWDNAVSSARKHPHEGVREKLAWASMPEAEVYRVTYYGFDDTPIRGWYLLPPGSSDKKLPCIVWFHGYHGSKGIPDDYAVYLMMGFAVFTVDVRGQGGETGNHLASSTGMISGWITQGILNKDESYYKAITIDGLRAVDWASEQPEIDAERIAIVGASQGGGLSLITSALSGKAAACVANVPNMCHMDYGMLYSTGSLTELARFADVFPEHFPAIMETLSYFDIVNLADRLTMPLFMSVGLKDTICMPETVFAAYNRIPSGAKHLEVYPFTGHTVNRHNNEQMRAFLRNQLTKPQG